MSSDGSFAHFETSLQCDWFVHYCMNLGIQIGHRCCYEKGVKLPSMSNSEMHDLVSEFIMIISN